MNSVFVNKSDCCGCGICSSICLHNAITMKEDDFGYTYPQIDSKRCIDCGLCKKMCAFGKQGVSEPKRAYAGTNLNAQQRRLSTSAGIFAAIASAFIERGGAVCGAAMELSDGQATVQHILIRSLEDLPRLQGSKYVQSDFSACCHDVLQALRDGMQVLISGTPCQIAAARSMFRKYQKQLVFIDIICHGVPSVRFFNDYLLDYQNRRKVSIKKFLFRDKTQGWDHKGSVLEENRRGKQSLQALSQTNSTYYWLFLQGEINRESCYTCPYACSERVGDITLGDYWGIDRLDPQLLVSNGGPIERNEGASCILVNTENGESLLESVHERLQYAQVRFENIRQVNTQLNRPAKYSKLRTKVLEDYASCGYAAVHKRIAHIMFVQHTRLKLVGAVPRPVKTALKWLLKK